MRGHHSPISTLRIAVASWRLRTNQASASSAPERTTLVRPGHVPMPWGRVCARKGQPMPCTCIAAALFTWKGQPMPCTRAHPAVHPARSHLAPSHLRLADEAVSGARGRDRREPAFIAAQGHHHAGAGGVLDRVALAPRPSSTVFHVERAPAPELGTSYPSTVVIASARGHGPMNSGHACRCPSATRTPCRVRTCANPVPSTRARQRSVAKPWP